MNEVNLRSVLIGWTVLFCLWAFVLFGFDKWRAGRGGQRVAESTLWWVSALGGWPGGLLGIIVFRHKSAKWSFLFMFAAAFLVWGTLVAAALKVAKG